MTYFDWYTNKKENTEREMFLVVWNLIKKLSYKTTKKPKVLDHNICGTSLQ